MIDHNIDSENASIDHEGIEELDFHEDRGFVRDVVAVTKAGDADKAYELLEPLHAADFANFLEVLTSNHRKALIALIGDKLDPELLADILSEVEGPAQDELYEQLPNEKLADAVTDMETDDAVYVLEELDEADRTEVLAALSADDRVAIEESLRYPEDSAARLMQRELVALPSYWTVGQTIDLLRSDDDDLPEVFYDVFVVDPSHRPTGWVPLSRLMRSDRTVALKDIMETEQHLINVTSDQEDVAYQFSKYNLISAAVTDEAGRLVGMITVDDVVDVIEDEAEEDILALAGVIEEDIGDSVLEVTKNRFTWLFVNLLTAVLASFVIGIFDTTIENLVALAILMPIVASMGGNAGTQTMTVAVRAIATKELSSTNAWRMVWREFFVAFLNGSMLAVIAGTIAWYWFDNQMLALVFAAAMIFNIALAGLSGILIPLGLDKIDVDPAIASSVFVTTITDVVGFFAFLGLAATVLPRMV